MKLSIKRLELRDIGPAMQLIRELFAETGEDLEDTYPKMDEQEYEQLAMLLLTNLANPHSLFLIAYDGKKPTGVFVGEVVQRAYGKPKVFGVARDLYVVPEKRGHEVGIKLLTTALNYAKALGLDRVETVARPGKAQTRWEKYGFKPYLVQSYMDLTTAPVYRHEIKPSDKPTTTSAVTP